MLGNEDFKSDDFKYPGFYRGLVLDNADPDELGRIKVRIFGVFSDDFPASVLPWAVPAMPIGSGAGVGYGCSCIPEIDSYVFCFFESNNLFQPVYFAEAPDGIHGLPSEMSTNYPYRKVLKSKNGIVIIIDDLDKEIYVNHPSGSYLKIDSEGNITISGTTVNINP